MKEMLFKNGVDKALTFSYDDGLPTDIRLAGIFDRNGLKATFNINSGLSACAEGVPLPETLTKSNMWTRTSLTALKETFANSPHEIALHGTKHYHPEELDEKGAEEEFASDKAALEQVFGKVVRGCAYAFGTYGDAARNELRKLGIHYARTIKSTLSFDIPKDFLALEPTCHHSNKGLNGDITLDELADKFLADTSGKAKLFYVWGHSCEFEVFDEWDIIERFAERMGGRDDIWYATNIEIIEYAEAYRRLEFSLDEKLVYNPSAQSIWLRTESGAVEAKPGKHTKLS